MLRQALSSARLGVFFQRGGPHLPLYGREVAGRQPAVCVRHSSLFSRSTVLPFSANYLRITPLVDRFQIPSRKQSTSVDNEVFSLLNLASQGKTEDLRELLNAGANINRSDYDNRTALHLAASEGHLETVQLLVDRGADVNATDRFGGTPLHDAMEARRADIASYLRSKGSHLGNRHQGLVQKVCHAAAAGNVSLLENVLENSFLTIQQCFDYDRRTPLHLAAGNGHMEVSDLTLLSSSSPLFLFSSLLYTPSRLPVTFSAREQILLPTTDLETLRFKMLSGE
jgi:hypothetical protein